MKKVGKFVKGLKQVEEADLSITAGGVEYSTFTRELIDMNAHVVCGYNGTDFSGTAIYAYLNTHRSDMGSFAMIGRVHLYPKAKIRRQIQKYFDRLEAKNTQSRNTTAIDELLEKLRAKPELAMALLELVA